MPRIPRVLPIRALPLSGRCTMEMERCPPEPVFRSRYTQLSRIMSVLASRSALLISRQTGENAIETINRLNDATENFNFASSWAESVWTGACSIEDTTCGDGLSREHAELVFSYLERAERKVRAYLEVVDELLATPAGPMTIAANAFRAKSIEEGLDSMPNVPPPPPRPTGSGSASSSSSSSSGTRAGTKMNFWVWAGAIGLGTFAIVRLQARADRRRRLAR